MLYSKTLLGDLGPVVPFALHPKNKPGSLPEKSLEK
jgi:hypothetical protein